MVPAAPERSELGRFSTGTPWLPYGVNISTANVVSELGDRQSLLWHYKSLMELQNKFPVLQTGAIQPVNPLSASEDLLYFSRIDQNGNKLLIIHNLAKLKGTIRLRNEPRFKLEPIKTGIGVEISIPAHGQIEAVLPPFSSGIWKIVH